jgi:hypothetical protein
MHVIVVDVTLFNLFVVLLGFDGMLQALRLLK